MKAKIINISIPEPLLKDADVAAKEESRSRSDIFREAMRSYLMRRELNELRRYGKQKADELGIKAEDVDGLVADYRAGRWMLS